MLRNDEIHYKILFYLFPFRLLSYTQYVKIYILYILYILPYILLYRKNQLTITRKIKEELSKTFVAYHL